MLILQVDYIKKHYAQPGVLLAPIKQSMMGPSPAHVSGSHAVHRLWCQNIQGGDPPGSFPVLKIYDGAYHQLLNEPNRDEVISDIIAFVLSGI